MPSTTTKAYKYFAIRMGNSILIRRTLKGIDKVTSRLYDTVKGLDMIQVNYIGGIPIASIKYLNFSSLTGLRINDNGIKALDKITYDSIKPYCVKWR